MQNNIAFLEDGEGVLLPDNLANFRDVTMSDRDKREKKCEILGIMLNYHLGWFLNTNDHSSALGTAETQYDIEKLNSIAPIKYTATFRLSPGEAKRVADRLQYVPLVFAGNNRHYNNTNRTVVSNRDLTAPTGGTPSVIINRIKKRGSRSNYYNNRVLCVNEKFWDTSDDSNWDMLLASLDTDTTGYYNRGIDSDYNTLILSNLVEDRSSHDSSWYESGLGETRINYEKYSNQVFAADLFNHLKECLTIRRNTPEILYTDAEFI